MGQYIGSRSVSISGYQCKQSTILALQGCARSLLNSFIIEIYSVTYNLYLLIKRGKNFFYVMLNMLYVKGS